MIASTPPLALIDGRAVAAWLHRIDDAERRVQHQDIIVYLRAESDTSDIADERADQTLSSQFDSLERERCRTLAGLGETRLEAYERATPSLRPYRYAISSCLSQAAHYARDAAAVEAIVEPVEAAMRDDYRALRARHGDVATHQDAYAAMLTAIVAAGNGEARLRGFASGVTAAYVDRGLEPKDVAAALTYLRSSNVNRDYVAFRATVHDTYSPPPMTIQQGLATIEAAEAPMGRSYASAFAGIFDPAAHRLHICTATRCDDTGFSLGYSGSTSEVFVGGFDGSVHAVKVIAHEAAHAVHRQFMNEGQPIGFYNEGPHFMFESFAIFNELLLYDHLYRTAQTPQARAHYLGLFVDDAVFQVYGSAEETDLEASMYREAAAGRLRGAADLDRLTATVFTRYDGVTPSTSRQLYWARDDLFFTDPLYDVNYLFAGMLALAYYQQFESNPAEFQRRYVAMLRNGFNDTPAAIERRFLGIDLSDVRGILRRDDGFIRTRLSQLRSDAAAAGTAPE